MSHISDFIAIMSVAGRKAISRSLILRLQSVSLIAARAGSGRQSDSGQDQHPDGRPRADSDAAMETTAKHGCIPLGKLAPGRPAKTLRMGRSRAALGLGVEKLV